LKTQELRNKLERQKGKREEVEKSLTVVRSDIKKAVHSLHDHEKAREIIRIVGQKTQQQLQFHISDIASLALDAVFTNPYQLAVDFVPRRNKTECDLYFVRDGNKIDPISASGVGAVDVTAFALRIAAWSMAEPRTRNVLILDEPFKHLKGEEENKQVLEMIRKISKKLKVQIIMVSDERVDREVTIDNTDRLFEVKIRKGISKVIQS
jgi:DNA repair exonuclease SbcCD ATPase subunit